MTHYNDQRPFPLNQRPALSFPGISSGRMLGIFFVLGLIYPAMVIAIAVNFPSISKGIPLIFYALPSICILQAYRIKTTLRLVVLTGAIESTLMATFYLNCTQASEGLRVISTGCLLFALCLDMVVALSVREWSGEASRCNDC